MGLQSSMDSERSKIEPRDMGSCGCNNEGRDCTTNTVGAKGRVHDIRMELTA
jgi:hypothetical protein